MARNDELHRLADAWNDAWNSRDARKLAAFFRDDGTYYEPQNPGEARPGKAGIAESAERTWAQWPEVKFEIVATIVEAPHVALEWRSSARDSGGKSVALEGVDLLRFDGDQLASVRVYYDVHQRQAAGSQ